MKWKDLPVRAVNARLNEHERKLSEQLAEIQSTLNQVLEILKANTQTENQNERD
tara:strand:- start:699 stop:860 length:162 start_codon:yes stop_codon:yes gene_type:complete